MNARWEVLNNTLENVFFVVYFSIPSRGYRGFWLSYSLKNLNVRLYILSVRRLLFLIAPNFLLKENVLFSYFNLSICNLENWFTF